ncbi:sigma-70 family RNA polymerase sigma factor [uncultured Draconibacterium sp.]|uniref:RNA polymerase sigma factor n=1 Tax=uncultured Draconibacterium sp. TaxID=1573823 RepID=UPI002AA84DD8|nr:sigma-70 family RNA polymerase sigma factor [uncultured Draconibacterium sp.]
MKYSDENLLGLEWNAFLEGNREAFAYFYNLHIDALFQYGTKIMADEDAVKDAIQEVFLDLYLKRKTNSADPYKLKFYLLLALKRNLIKRLKRERRFTETSEEIDFIPEYSIETRIIDKEQQEEINRKISILLSQLPAKQKEAIYLRYNQSLEYSEVAKVLNISVESARKQIYRALKSVKKLLKSENINFFILFKSSE